MTKKEDFIKKVYSFVANSGHKPIVAYVSPDYYVKLRDEFLEDLNISTGKTVLKFTVFGVRVRFSIFCTEDYIHFMNKEDYKISFKRNKEFKKHNWNGFAIVGYHGEKRR